MTERLADLAKEVAEAVAPMFTYDCSSMDGESVCPVCKQSHRMATQIKHAESCALLLYSLESGLRYYIWSVYNCASGGPFDTERKAKNYIKKHGGKVVRELVLRGTQ